MTRQVTPEVVSGFLAADDGPCVSVYLPTHRANPDNLQDPIRFRNLVRDAEASLRERYPGREAGRLLERYHDLASDYHFWKHQRDGLAVLGSGERFEVFRLGRPVKELAVVAENFHLKPLLRIAQSADRYHVLCLDRHKAGLFEGDRDGLEEVDTGDMPVIVTAALGDELTEPHQTVASYGDGSGAPRVPHGEPAVYHGHGSKRDETDKDAERFFRVIDREVLARFSRPSGLPLVLAALPEYHAHFRRVSHNPFLRPGGVGKNPWSLSAESLREEVWKLIEPAYLDRLARLCEDYHTGSARGQGAAELPDVAKAAVAGRVGVLLVEADRVIPGRFDRLTGETRPDRLADPEVDDLIDDVAEAVLRAGGQVVVVPAERMPTATGLAATFRY